MMAGERIATCSAILTFETPLRIGLHGLSRANFDALPGKEKSFVSATAGIILFKNISRNVTAYYVESKDETSA